MSILALGLSIPASWLCSAVQGSSDSEHAQWLLREYLSSDYFGLVQPVDWRGISPPTPDVDGNGYLDFVLTGHVIGNWPQLTLAAGSFGVPQDLDLRTYWSEPVYFGFQMNTGFLLNAGSEVHAAGFDSYHYGVHGDRSLLRIWNWSSMSTIMDIPIPAGPGAGLPDPAFWSGGHPVGDLNGDGFDEIADCTTDENGAFAITILIDGRTKAMKWMQYMPSPSAPMPWYDIPSSPYLDPFADVNGDGVLDFPIAMVSNYFSGVLGVRCLSGGDGSTIWERWYPGGAVSGASIINLIGDLNGDGVRELIYGEAATMSPSASPGRLMAIDGSSGSILWDQRLIDYDPNFDPQNGFLRFLVDDAMQDIVDQDGDGVRDVVAEAVVQRDIHMSREPRIAVISGSDGSGIRLERRIIEMDPWAPGFVDYLSRLTPVGDLDGDGWPEFATSYRAWNSVGIIGRRTLALTPEEAGEGEVAEASLWIPAGAGKEYQLLLSDVFDNNRASVVRDGWDTHLLASPVLSASAQNQRLRGTLDADGRARFQFRIPQGRGLAGGTLYAIALVRDPASPDEVLVKSSLGMIEVLP